MNLVKLKIPAILLLLLSSPLSALVSPTAKPIVVGRYEGLVSPVSERYLDRLLSEADRLQAQAAVLLLDTSGGMLSPTEAMVQQILEADIPVVVYVSPQGAKAALEGTFLLTASDIAVMAPHTSLENAHPIDKKGNKLNEKNIHAMAEALEALALNKGRNSLWAKQAVLEGVRLGEKEALEQGVIEGIVADEAQLMVFLQDRQGVKNGKEFRLSSRRAQRIDLSFSWTERLLSLLEDTHIAYVLFLLGFCGIIFEIKTPGFGAGGLLGMLSLGLAFVSFDSLPINYGGLALLSFGILLMITEAVVVSGGILGLGGAVAMFFGSFLLFGLDSEAYRVSLSLIALMVGVSSFVFLYLMRDAVKVLRRRVLQNTASLIGQRGTCLTAVRPRGIVHVDGEDWAARCAEGSVKKGEGVRVIGLYGLSLVVEGLLPEEKEKIPSKTKSSSSRPASKKNVLGEDKKNSTNIQNKEKGL